MEVKVRTKIKAAIQMAFIYGSRKVRITFKSEATWYYDVIYLQGMENMGFITLNDHGKLIMLNFKKTGKWNYEYNRTLEVTFTDNFDEALFVDAMWRCLENIEAVNQ